MFNQLEIKLEKLLRDYPNSYPLYNLQGAYRKIIKDFDKAEISFKEAIKINDKIPDAHNNLGLLYIDQNKIDESIDCFNKAIKGNSDNPFFLIKKEMHLLKKIYITKH